TTVTVFAVTPCLTSQRISGPITRPQPLRENRPREKRPVMVRPTLVVRRYAAGPDRPAAVHRDRGVSCQVRRKSCRCACGGCRIAGRGRPARTTGGGQ